MLFKDTAPQPPQLQSLLQGSAAPAQQQPCNGNAQQQKQGVPDPSIQQDQQQPQQPDTAAQQQQQPGQQQQQPASLLGYVLGMVGRLNLTFSDLPYAALWGEDPIPDRPQTFHLAGLQEGYRLDDVWRLMRRQGLGNVSVLRAIIWNHSQQKSVKLIHKGQRACRVC
jgi:hypothetical protein